MNHINAGLGSHDHVMAPYSLGFALQPRTAHQDPASVLQSTSILVCMTWRSVLEVSA